MKSQKQLLSSFTIFTLGLCAGLLLRNPIEKGLHLSLSEIASPVVFKEADSKRTLPVVVPILEKEAFTIAYDARNKNPYFVVEVLTAEGLKGSADRNTHQFREDESIPLHMRSALEDYRGSGFDRGHMAPAANCKKSVKRMAESFFLSNMCPQEPQFNRGYWAKFEGRVRDLTKSYRSVTVFTGPLYLPQGKRGERFVMYRVIGQNDVAVPTAFFKVLRLERESGAIEERAYIMPNEHIAPETPLKTFQVTVQKVEQISGILFH